MCRVIDVFSLVNGDIALTDDFKSVFLNDDCRSLIEADSEEIGVFTNHWDQIELTILSEEVLIDAHILQESESHFMISHEDLICPRVASNEIRSLNRGTRRAAANDAVSFENLLELLVDEGV